MNKNVHYVGISFISFYNLAKTSYCNFAFLKELNFLRQEASEGACSCSIFAIPEIDPIVEHTLQYNVSCDQESDEKCKQLCIALVSSLFPLYTIYIQNTINVSYTISRK